MGKSAKRWQKIARSSPSACWFISHSNVSDAMLCISMFNFNVHTNTYIHNSTTLHIKQWAITMRFAVIGFDLFEDENYDRQKDIFDLYE